MCHNRYIEYTLMYIGYVEYNEYSFMYFITVSWFLNFEKVTVNFHLFHGFCFMDQVIVNLYVSLMVEVKHLLGPT